MSLLAIIEGMGVGSETTSNGGGGTVTQPSYTRPTETPSPSGIERAAMDGALRVTMNNEQLLTV